MDEHDHVFVTGLHRSGTTLLYRLLGDHPEASRLTDTGVPADEGNHLQDVLPEDPWGVGKFGFDPRLHLTEGSELATEATREALWEAWSPYWDLERRFLVEKSPRNTLQTRFLQELFPGARFLIVLRHPVAAVGSQMRWMNVTPRVVPLHHWVRAHRILEEDLRDVERFHVVKYEELTEDPMGTMADVFRWLGLEPVEHGFEVRRGGNVKYLDAWREARSGWRAPYVRGLERVYGPRIERFGYAFDELDAWSPWRGPSGG